MSDSYQAIYDAVRSRISNGDVGSALERVASQSLDVSHAKALLQEQIWHVGSEMTRPSVLHRPSLSVDGTKWCAMLGDNLMDGLAGFGETPDAAMRAFDTAFLSQRTPAAILAATALAA